MNFTTARFTVGRRVVVGLIIIVALGLIAMLTIYRGLNTVQSAVDRLFDVDEPLNAAAYEMEINVNGIAFAILTYLATGRSEYRDRVAQDNADFLSYHAEYRGLVETQGARKNWQSKWRPTIWNFRSWDTASCANGQNKSNCSSLSRRVLKISIASSIRIWSPSQEIFPGRRKPMRRPLPWPIWKPKLPRSVSG